MDAQGNATLTTTRSFDTTDRSATDLRRRRIVHGAYCNGVRAARDQKRDSHGLTAPGAEQQQVKDGILEVRRRASSRCRSRARRRCARRTWPRPRTAGRERSRGTDTFTVRFSADAASSMDFKLTAPTASQSRAAAAPIVLKGDEPPQFKLLCPRATACDRVASIPDHVRSHR